MESVKTVDQELTAKIDQSLVENPTTSKFDLNF